MFLTTSSHYFPDSIRQWVWKGTALLPVTYEMNIYIQFYIQRRSLRFAVFQAVSLRPLASETWVRPHTNACWAGGGQSNETSFPLSVLFQQRHNTPYSSSSTRFSYCEGIRAKPVNCPRQCCSGIQTALDTEVLAYCISLFQSFIHTSSRRVGRVKLHAVRVITMQLQQPQKLTQHTKFTFR
jgi:hypothetical protein